jgi:hypothetical protein
MRLSPFSSNQRLTLPLKHFELPPSQRILELSHLQSHKITFLIMAGIMLFCVAVEAKHVS